MKFSYDWIQELAGVQTDVADAAAALTAKAFEIEDVVGVGKETVLEAKILPNRPDCLSHLGVARELCALTHQHFSAPSYEYRINEHSHLSIEVEDTQACPRYSALLVRGVKVGPSPDWLVSRLVLCGLKSINNVVDITNYVMLELGQPMHAFDAQRVSKIVVRHAKEGEKLRALDEAQTEYALKPSMLVITDGETPLAIAGVKGGVGTGISDDTQDVLLEAAHFDPVSIRATSRALGLRTDASVRFAYGTDPNLTTAALMRAAELLAKVASGTADAGIIDVYPVPRIPLKVMLDPAYARSLLGVAVEGAQMKDILNSLGFEIADHAGHMQVTVPTRRLDVSTPEDCIEEIGRVYGYESLVSVSPVFPVYDERNWVREDAENVAWDEYGFIRERSAITHLLAGAGYSEVYNYAFISDELKELLHIPTAYELAQPQSGEYRWLRRSLVPRLLLNIRDNMRFEDDISLFETGHVFDHVSGEDANPRHARESVRVGVVRAQRGTRRELFYELKGAVDLLLERLGITDVYYDDAIDDETGLWDAGAMYALAHGQRALIRHEGDGHVIGVIGLVNAACADALKIKGTTAVAELCLRSLVRLSQGEREFEPLPKYPSVVRDIAVLVDAGTKIDDILQTIQGADTSGIIEDVDVFDIFLPTGKEKLKAEGDTPEYGKSVAFHITYRASDRTLTDGEVQEVEQTLIRALQEKLDARVR